MDKFLDELTIEVDAFKRLVQAYNGTGETVYSAA